MIEILNQDWQDWISSNLQRNCSKADMLNSMLQANISEDTARFNLQHYRLIAQDRASAEALIAASSSNVQFMQEASYITQSNNELTTCDGQKMAVQLRLDKPDIVLLDHFMTHAECDALCALSADSLRKSTVVNDVTGEAVNHEARTSQGMHFTLGQHALIRSIEARIAEITSVPVTHGEGIQILRYAPGGEYRPHFDYFSDNEGGRTNQLKGGQRIITIIMYLNDVSAGGATVFPELNLHIYPKKGSALYFSYSNSIGQTNPLTLHAGAPVVRGEKWIATKWLREHVYG